MRYLSASEWYALLALSPLPLGEFMHALRTYADTPEVQRFRTVEQRFSGCGDEESNRAFYRCFYSDRVPGLNISWSEAYARVHFPGFEEEVLPELARFCDGPERRARVLDVGCGDGFVLCYLASQFSDIEFTGVDACHEAVVRTEARIASLGLKNVRVLEGDGFSPVPDLGHAFDGAILRNVVDDTREAWTSYLDARFDTVRKLRAIWPLLTANARMWVSMTPYPHRTPEFEDRVRRDLAAAGFAAFPALAIPYTMHNQRTVHLSWTICPSEDTPESSSALPRRSEYIARYHYPKGAAIPVEDAVLAEQCYVNLPDEATCPRCSTPDASIIYSGGPARTSVNFYKVLVRVFTCANPGCQHGYPVAEVID